MASPAGTTAQVYLCVCLYKSPGLWLLLFALLLNTSYEMYRMLCKSLVHSCLLGPTCSGVPQQLQAPGTPKTSARAVTHR